MEDKDFFKLLSTAGNFFFIIIIINDRQRFIWVFSLLLLSMAGKDFLKLLLLSMAGKVGFLLLLLSVAG